MKGSSHSSKKKQEKPTTAHEKPLGGLFIYFSLKKAFVLKHNMQGKAHKL